MTRRSSRFTIGIIIVTLLTATFLWLTGGAWAGVNTPQGGAASQAQVGSGFTYQGELLQSGNPANGKFDFRFRLFDAVTGGSQVGSTVTKNDVQVTNGRFTVVLDFGPGIFKSDARWLEIAVRPGNSTGAYTVLNPRQRLNPVPYALALPGLWTEQNSSSPNIIGGYNGNAVHPDVVGATISGGGAPNAAHTVGGDYGTVGGGRANTASGQDATVSGGWRNVASGDSATVSGGDNNAAENLGATIGGGGSNTASDFYATVAGGHRNTAGGLYSTIGGGFQNTASEEGATIAGGTQITVTGKYATVGGGKQNLASGEGATIGGGIEITATGKSATVGGGRRNEATDEGSTVGGGLGNRASYMASTVAGGMANVASYSFATVGGGWGNRALGPYTTVAGGTDNQAEYEASTVGGGSENQAKAHYATIPGGTGARAITPGQFAYASGGFPIGEGLDAPQQIGSAQFSLYVLKVQTPGTDNTLYDMGEVDVPMSTTLTFDILVTARDQYGLSAGWSIQGVIENTNGTTQLVGTPIITTISNDYNWQISVRADDTPYGDGLVVSGGGVGEGPIRWVAVVRTAQVQW